MRRLIHGGDAARLLGAPDLSAAADVDALVGAVRAEAGAGDAGRWVVLSGASTARFSPHALSAAVLDAAAPRRPTCVWSADHEAAWLNTLACEAARSAPFVEGLAVEAVRRVLPRWTLETWKERLLALQDALVAGGVREIRDVDPDAAEGWRALDDDGALRLDVETLLAPKGLRPALLRGARPGEGTPRARLIGVAWREDGGGWSAARIAEETALAEARGFAVVRYAPSDVLRRVAGAAPPAASS
ncbi:MAG TPA: hypothetical protein VEI02_13140 [Planctomycetota bacterium]|nr:hypothetical protein [Planctomycetota bacterium]